MLDEEKPDFDCEHEHALTVAAESLTLDELQATLECWRRVAWMTYADPDEHRRTLRTAAERFSQQPVPDDEPVTATKERAGPVTRTCTTSIQIPTPKSRSMRSHVKRWRPTPKHGRS